SRVSRVICASPDSDHLYAFGIWTYKPIRPTPVDYELLSLFGLIFQSLFNDMVLVKKLRATNKLLAETSAKMANVESLAAMADMTSGVAHEFNNIFGAAIGRIQLMRAKGGDDKLQSDLGKIEKQLLEGAQTVKRIQQFTSSAKYKKPEMVDVAEIVRNCADPTVGSFVKLAESRNVTVEVSVGMGEAFIMGNQADLATAIDQLILNAVENATQESTVQVTLSGDERQIKLTVTDKGPGIPVANQKKVFYPFFSTKGTRGAGLGLAIVHGTVVRHDGRISLQSEEGKVTTIHLAFRRAEHTGDISEISKRTKKAHNLSILIVDDDEQIREVLSDMLSVDGHKTTICGDGPSALKELSGRSFDMMITDLGMPGMTGLELSGRAHKQFPKMPIAMITGWGNQLNQEELSAHGVKAILPKPFHLKDIKSLVQEMALAAS
ncbi:MAG: hybrid sensor histidine kinase/response regulator, partial [Candidatus Zixiibacteriota bacterium]